VPKEFPVKIVPNIIVRCMGMIRAYGKDIMVPIFGVLFASLCLLCAYENQRLERKNESNSTFTFRQVHGNVGLVQSRDNRLRRCSKMGRFSSDANLLGAKCRHWIVQLETDIGFKAVLDGGFSY